MASKRRQRRLKLAAARREKAIVRSNHKPTLVWNPAHAKWEEAKPAPKPAVHYYTVAAQKGDGKPIEVCDFLSDDDDKLVQLVLRHYGVTKEQDFTILDIHKKVDDKIVIVRESDMESWPKNAAVITRKGVISAGYTSPLRDLKDVPAKEPAKPATTAIVTWKVAGESYIPRNKFKLNWSM